jgi:8-amino-7-oxononanoate synthase
MLDRMAADLSALRDTDQLRNLTIPSGIPLSSNDYLGLAANPRLRQAIARAVTEDDRVASTGSRLLSGNHSRWEELEAHFAEFVGTGAALYFSSGYAANIGLLTSVLRPEDTVFSDAANHASLVDGIRLSRAKKVIFPHLDLNYLEDALRGDNATGRKLIVVEAIFSMDGDHAPLPNLIALCDRFGAYLIVDEAHSTGVEGIAGRGCSDSIRSSDRILATIHTCGKAMASMGAFVAGSRTLRDFLINHARSFIFSTALPPYCAAHLREALPLVREADAARAHLRKLGDHLRDQMRVSGLDCAASDSQIVPLILGPNDIALRVASAVSSAGFSIRAIRPPTVPSGSARLRFSLNANLAMNDIETLVRVLTEAVRESEVVRE